MPARAGVSQTIYVIDAEDCGSQCEAQAGFFVLGSELAL
jgi:hypothetical protein